MAQTKWNILKTKLLGAGFDPSELKSLRDVAMLGGDRLAVRAAQIQRTERQMQFPTPLLATPAEKIIPTWEQLDALRDDLGFSPILLGNQFSVARHWELENYGKFPQAYLDQATACSATTWFDDEVRRRSDIFDRVDIHGDWDETITPTTFAIPRSFYRQDSTQYIGFFSTLRNWEIPAYLPFGCWNECPCPEIQVCIHQYWHEQYQSRIIALAYDMAICHVEKPPKTREEALALAQQQMLYCSDLVFQGTGTIERLAATLLNSTYWQFWWD